MVGEGGAAGGSPIAIVGIGCRFPGGVADTSGFWQLLTDGVDAIGEIPPDRFDIERYFDPTPATPGKVMSRWGGFIQQRLDAFDAEFFGLSRTYAERLDPQQRLLLETAWEAMEDSGLDVARLDGSPTGVFIGQWLSDFEHRLFADHGGIDFPMTLGTGRYAAPGRVSYAFGLRGPSLSVDAGCSAGLAAVHLAVRSLRSGECSLALAGAVNLILQPHITVAYSQSRMMAPDGRCKFGDAAGDGYVRAEGAAVVALKTLAQARADGDRVYAVIRGSAVNNDGKSSGSMGTPSRIGQQALIHSALRDAGVSPAQVAYVEAHGTGTRAGDPVELGALAAVLAEGRPTGSKVQVGSVKTNIGHTEAVAGVAGLIKGALMLHHGVIPPSLHFTRPNPDIDWRSTPVAIPTEAMPWPESAHPSIMGVSAFGIGGTNAHVVLEADAAPVQQADAPADAAPFLLPLSARSDAALRALAARYAEAMVRPDAPALADVCWSAATRRTALSHRAAFVAPDREGLVAALRAFADGEQTSAVGVVHDAEPRRVALVVPGQGGQWVGMARELAARSSAFRASLEASDAAARRHVEWSLLEQLLHLDPGAPGYLGDRIDVIQPSLVALAMAYAAWLQSLGITPHAVVGHSLGEVAAAAIAGVIDLSTAMRIICTRSALMQRVSGEGAMAVVELSHADAEVRLRGHASVLSVAASNAPRSSVISGEPEAMNRVLAELQAEGVFCRRVNVDVASHSPQMAPLAAELVRVLSDVSSAAGEIPVYSTVHASRMDGTAFGGAYWGRNLREPVQFGATVERMLDDGLSVFIEVGPHPVLTQAVQETAHSVGRESVAVACGRRDTPDLLPAHEVIASLWASGAAVDWLRVMPAGGRTVDLPLYPWQRERHWMPAADLSTAGAEASPGPALDVSLRQALHSYVWRYMPPDAANSPRTPRRWIVVGEPSPHAESLAAALRAEGYQADTARSMHAAGVLLRESSAADIAEPCVLALPPDSREAPYSPVAGLNALQQALRAAASRVTPRVWWCTFGAHAVAGHRPAEWAVPHAARWGAALVLAEEHPDWWGGLVDLASDPAAAGTVSAAVVHLAAFDGEDQVAVRDGKRYVLRLAPLDDVQPAIHMWRADASYLITGGLGGVALRLAEQMVREGARRLVLLGRTSLPPRTEWSGLDVLSLTGRRVAAVQALEHRGASVHLMTADVSDEDSMRAALAQYAAHAWPPVAGVFHNAGVLESHLSSDMTEAAFERVVTPKLRGAAVLDRVFPDVELFVIASSISPYWAPSGMTNYGAANVGCDALAVARRARGRHALSIQWGPWHGLGMTDSASMRRSVSELERLGVRAISGDEGSAIFSTLLSRSEAVIAVLPVDWRAYREMRGARSSRLFEELAGQQQGTSAAGTSASVLADAEPLERRSQLQSLLLAVVGGVLRRPAASIDARQPFGTMGVDSLATVEIRNRLETALGRPLSAALVWNYPTIHSLVAHLDVLIAPTAASTSPATLVEHGAPGQETLPDHAALLGDVSGLSDDDVIRALRAGR